MIDTVRIVALYVAIVLCVASVAGRSWAHAEFGGMHAYASSARIEVGTRDFAEIHGSEIDVEPLRELNLAGVGFENKGRYAFYAAIAAAIAFAVASELLRRRKLQLRWRIGLAVPAVVSVVCAARFVDHLVKKKYLDIGWGAYAAIAAAILGTAALFISWEQRE